jgi:opacity protein-like surface antigen
MPAGRVRRPASPVIVLAALAALAASVPSARAHAQSLPARATVASVTPYVGYITFGDFASGPLGTSVSNAAAPLIGVALGLDMSPRLSLVGNLGFADSKLRGNLPLLGGYNFGDSKVFLFDAGLRFQLLAPATGGPSATPASQFVPFVEGGVGAIRFNQSVGPLDTDATNLAVNVGAGVDVRLSPRYALRLSVKDYIGKFDFSDALGQAIGGRIESKVANNFALTAGLTLRF